MQCRMGISLIRSNNNNKEDVQLCAGFRVDLIIGGKNTVTLCDGEGFDKLNVKKVKFVKITKKPNFLILKAKIIKN